MPAISPTPVGSVMLFHDIVIALKTTGSIPTPRRWCRRGPLRGRRCAIPVMNGDHARSILVPSDAVIVRQGKRRVDVGEDATTG